MFSTKILVAFIAIVLILPICALIGREMTLKETPTQTTQSHTTEVAIGQALDSIENPAETWKEGRDYRLSDKKYFQNKDWLVLTIKITKGGQNDPATIVMKRDGSSYQVIMGPGTDFPSDELPGLPQEVVQHLRDIGRVSES